MDAVVDALVDSDGAGKEDKVLELSEGLRNELVPLVDCVLLNGEVVDVEVDPVLTEKLGLLGDDAWLDDEAVLINTTVSALVDRGEFSDN